MPWEDRLHGAGRVWKGLHPIRAPMVNLMICKLIVIQSENQRTRTTVFMWQMFPSTTFGTGCALISRRHLVVAPWTTIAEKHTGKGLINITEGKEYSGCENVSVVADIPI